MQKNPASHDFHSLMRSSLGNGHSSDQNHAPYPPQAGWNPQLDGRTNLVAGGLRIVCIWLTSVPNRVVGVGQDAYANARPDLNVFLAPWQARAKGGTGRRSYRISTRRKYGFPASDAAQASCCACCEALIAGATGFPVPVLFGLPRRVHRLSVTRDSGRDRFANRPYGHGDIRRGRRAPNVELASPPLWIPASAGKTREGAPGSELLKQGCGEGGWRSTA